MPYLAALLLTVAAGPAWADEDRCGELDALYGAGTCLCSEPLDTQTYIEVIASHWNPADSTTRECALFNVAGAAVVRSNPNDFSGSNDPTILSAFPAGAAVARVFKQVDNFGGQGMFLGGYFPSNAPTARRATRAYVYFSNPFSFSDQVAPGECANSGKIVDFTFQGPTLTQGGQWAIYAWDPNWNIGAYNCCAEGPGSEAGAQAALSQSAVKGKWHRIEAVATNLAGTPARLQVYWKNVTDDGPDWLIVDTAVPTSQGPFNPAWTSTQATTLTNLAGRDEMIWNLFRWDGDNPARPCLGYFAMSHILNAAWSTDTGQRIGAASEIEGGTGPTAPNNVTGVNVCVTGEPGC